MKKHILSLILFSMGIIFLVNLSYCSKYTAQDKGMINKVFKTQDIVSLFALTVEDIQNNVIVYLDQAQQKVNEIIAIPDSDRTFSNTAKALDELVSLSDLAIAQRSGWRC